MEIDPGTVSLDTLQKFRHLGINRASFGAQTFNNAELKRLNRRHTVAEIHSTFADLCRAGFTNISFDLIAGLPAQTVSAFAHNIGEALSLRPTHLSFYILEIHEGTPLANLIERGRAPVPDDDAAAEMYRLLCEHTAVAGYTHYEISNFCLPNRESRHNTKYWTRAPVFGFGCSAHSHDGALVRWHNERNAQAYIELVESGASPVAGSQRLAPHEIASESLFLGLRLMRGVDLERHHAEFGRDVRGESEADVAQLHEAGLIEVSGDVLRLTTRGALLSNEVFARLC